MKESGYRQLWHNATGRTISVQKNTFVDVFVAMCALCVKWVGVGLFNDTWSQ